MKKTIKLDDYNKKILKTLHLEANLSNNELASRVNLSASACFQRVKAMKEAGYFKSFYADVNLDLLCEHVMAYVEFSLDDNRGDHRRKFITAINDVPEFVDCVELSGDVDYISLSCFPNLKELNEACVRLSDDKKLSIKRINTRIILDKPKWFLGYPIDNLKWLV